MVRTRFVSLVARDHLLRRAEGTFRAVIMVVDTSEFVNVTSPVVFSDGGGLDWIIDSHVVTGFVLHLQEISGSTAQADATFHIGY